MKVACPRGNINGSHPLAHDMTAISVEELVYVLTAMLADEQSEPTDLDVGTASHELMGCPLHQLRAGRDPEAYAEHIESMLDQRRRFS